MNQKRSNKKAVKDEATIGTDKFKNKIVQKLLFWASDFNIKNEEEIELKIKKK
ncbi:hypothetical protein BCR32DRAFT_284725 [Anaeromyces robustus]|uniref:Uncharacterized protein n=1 Tax=Anaeromyces robustus TaxID=1754192 RepID=A0A1Y1WQX5_9FUNG|nr:hypothetical protein BCR32DRAFT_284725 [Anaeromyces robustus]|eukprot:ORX75943.1 hypothetical protein BCR32DRAFT_284725 [Anaeromyces robustus]